MTRINVSVENKVYGLDLDDSLYNLYTEIQQGKLKYPCGSEKELMSHVWRIGKYMDEYLRNLATGKIE